MFPVKKKLPPLYLSAVPPLPSIQSPSTLTAYGKPSGTANHSVYAAFFGSPRNLISMSHPWSENVMGKVWLAVAAGPVPQASGAALYQFTQLVSMLAQEEEGAGEVVPCVLLSATGPAQVISWRMW